MCIFTVKKTVGSEFRFAMLTQLVSKWGNQDTNQYVYTPNPIFLNSITLKSIETVVSELKLQYCKRLQTYITYI